MNPVVPSTLFEKIWQRHVVLQDEGSALLHIGRHLVHEGSRNAFQVLADHGLPVRCPERTFATPDHYVATTREGTTASADPRKQAMVDALASNTRAQGVHFFGLDDVRQGIVHVVGPEQGISLPGLIIVCGDSHTATHGALGALAFGIGSSEVAHVLATQSLWQARPKTMRISVQGHLRAGVCAKDLILAIISRIGAGGAVGHVIEYAGSAISDLDMEGRMTLCNMSIEAGARAGMIAPDEKTFAYIKGRPHAPSAQHWHAAVADWQTLHSDPDASFDAEFVLDAQSVSPMVTWGTSPQDACALDDVVPDPGRQTDPARRDAMRHALDYMGLQPGQALADVGVDRVFIGSCTNGRIEDLRAAAQVFAGRTVCVPTLVVPGSSLVRQQAQAEGLDVIFEAAGVQWRQSGCSMCVGMNGDTAAPGERTASTTNRNFIGRQGQEVRTHLVSPATAAASALTGRLTDARHLQEMQS